MSKNNHSNDSNQSKQSNQRNQSNDSKGRYSKTATRESLTHLRDKLCEIDSAIRRDLITEMQHQPGCRMNALPHRAMEAAVCSLMQSKCMTLDSPMYMHYAALLKMARYNCPLSEEVLWATLDDVMSATGDGEYSALPRPASTKIIGRVFACSEEPGRLREFCTRLRREARCQV